MSNTSDNSIRSQDQEAGLHGKVQIEERADHQRC